MRRARGSRRVAVLWGLAAAATSLLSSGLLCDRGCRVLPRASTSVLHKPPAAPRLVLKRRRRVTPAVLKRRGLVRLASSYGSLYGTKKPEDHDSTVIWLHGLGDTGMGWAEVGRTLRELLPTTRFLFPTAPVQPVTCNMGAAMNSWFDVNSLMHEEFELDPPGLAESADYVQALVRQQLEEGIQPARQVLVGFSQGGAVVLAAALRGPAQGAPPVGAVLALSSFLACRPPAELPRGSCPPVHFFHGSDDVVVPAAWARVGCEELRKLGLHASFKAYEGIAHSTSAGELDDVSEVLLETLG